MIGTDASAILHRIELKLDGIYRILEIQSRQRIEEVLAEIASSKERRKAWILADGEMKTEEIARVCGVAVRTVQIFVQEAERAGLIDASKRGYPKKRFGVVPSGWGAESRELESQLMSESPEKESGNE